MRRLTPDISRVAKPRRLDGVVRLQAENRMETIESYARNMQRQIAQQLDALGEWVTVKTHEGAKLHARYQWWGAKQSASPREWISHAKGLYAMARDMEARPIEYRFPRRDEGQTCWRRFQELRHAT